MPEVLAVSPPPADSSERGKVQEIPSEDNPQLSRHSPDTVVPMSQSPWTYSAAMELPLTRSLNSSSSESSIDSGFESPLGKGSGSPVSRVSNASLSDAISTTSTLTNMLNRLSFSSASCDPHHLSPDQEHPLFPILPPLPSSDGDSSPDTASSSSSPDMLELSPSDQSWLTSSTHPQTHPCLLYTSDAADE